MGATAGAAGAGAGSLIGSLAGLSASQLRSTLGDLSDSDVMRLKRSCAEVLSNPGAYAASTVAVCQVIASL
jgi:hypothetical protein